MNREGLINIFDTAKLTKMDIAIEVTVPGQETTEVIINRNLPEQCKNCSFLEVINLDKLEARCFYKVKDKCIFK